MNNRSGKPSRLISPSLTGSGSGGVCVVSYTRSDGRDDENDDMGILAKAFNSSDQLVYQERAQLKNELNL